MHEKLTIGSQLENRIRRGGSLTWSALPDPAVEYVIYRKSPELATRVLDYQILESERTKGIADCIGRWQGKIGTQIRSQTDPSALHSAVRGLKELFWLEIAPKDLNLAGIVGPWIHRATAKLYREDLILSILEDQGEETSFQAQVFTLDVTRLRLDPSNGPYSNATKGARWVSIRQLVTERGEDASYLYWSTVAVALRGLRGRTTLKNLNTYFPPGEYRF